MWVGRVASTESEADVLYLPSTNKRTANGRLRLTGSTVATPVGIVTTDGQSGAHIRRQAFPLQPRTLVSQAWRNIFLSAKQNWASLAEGGTGYVLTSGIEPQQAWAMLAATYFGIMQGPLVANGVLLMRYLVGCSSPDAFSQMCQVNRASMGLTPLPAPTLDLSGAYPVIANPVPFFAYPSKLSCSIYYDAGLNVIGIYCDYTWVEDFPYPLFVGLDAIPGVWQVLASASYKSGTAAPAAKDWKPILFYGPYLPTPSMVLTAWKAVYGSLPAAGSIKFQLQYIHAETGASGPPLSATAIWATGTLKGFYRAGWTGPIYAFDVLPGDIVVTAPGSSSTTFILVGHAGYSGTITFKVAKGAESSLRLSTWSNALPPGVTFTFSPASVTFSGSYTDTQVVTVTAAAASGAQYYDGSISVSCTDGISTLSSPLALLVQGAVAYPPEPGSLTMDPSQASPTLPSPGSVSITFTVQNTLAGDMPVTMSAAVVGYYWPPGFDLATPPVTLTFDKVDFVIAAGSYASPTAVTVVMTAAAVASVTTLGIAVQVSATSGKVIAQSAVQFS
jgi:hypothetical protein